MARDNIVLWNANGLDRSRAPLIQAIPPSVSLALITETHRNAAQPPLHTARLRHSVSYASPADYRSGGVAILSARPLVPRPDICDDTPNTAAAIVNDFSHSLPSLLVICVYRSARNPANSVNAMGAIMARAAATNLPILLGGDLNVRSTAFGDSESSTDGDALAEHAASNGLVCLNMELAAGAATRHHPRMSILDLFFSNVPHAFKELLVDPPDCPLPSDHSPLLLSCARTRTPPPARASRLNFKRANWLMFRKSCTATARRTLERFTAALAITDKQQAIDTAWLLFKQTILESAACSVPRMRARPDAACNAWWHMNPALPVLLRRYYSAHRAHSRHRSDASLATLRRASALWKKAVFTAKRISWSRFASSVERRSGIVHWPTWTASNGCSRPQLGVLAADGTAPANIAAAADNLAHRFADVCTLPIFPDDDFRMAQCTRNTPVAVPTPLAAPLTRRAPLDNAALLQQCSSPLTAAEVTDQLLGIRCSGAIGPDDLYHHCIRHLPPLLLTWARALFNHSLTHGVLPIDARSSNVVPIPKGSARSTDAGDYRPISLTSVFWKSLEHLLHRRIWTIAEAHIHPLQSGFRSNSSCADLLLALHSAILRHTAHPGSHLHVAFLDISKAFDRVHIPTLLQRCWRIGIRGRLWRWLRAWLSGRRMRIVYQDTTSAWCNINAGTPQGGVLSPVLFLIYVNCLLEELYAAGLTPLFYADDIALYSDRPNAIARDTALSRGLGICAAWAARSHVVWGVAKSGVVRFSRPFAGPRPCTRRFFLGDQELPMPASYKYLGVLFSDDLTWTAHARATIAKAQRTVPLITRLISQHHRPHLPVVRTLVKAVLAPVISYGMVVWQPAEKECRQLDALLALPLRCCLRLPWNIHRLSLLTDCGIHDCAAMVARARASFLHRACSLKCAPLTRGIMTAVLNSIVTPGCPLRPLYHSFAAAHRTMHPPAWPMPATLALPPAGVSHRRAADRDVYTRARNSGAVQDFWRLRAALPTDVYTMAPHHFGDCNSAAALRTRIRLNRSYCADSLARRGIIASNRCTRTGCDPTAHDTVEHWLIDCQHPPLVALRAQYPVLFGSPRQELLHALLGFTDPSWSIRRRVSTLHRTGRYLAGVARIARPSLPALA